MTRAIAYTALGSPEVLHLVDLPGRDPDAGEVLVSVEAAGVNPIDAKLRSGLRRSAPPSGPVVPGADGAGVIVAVGSDVEGLAIGDPVVFRNAPGAYADRVVVAAGAVVPRPPRLSAVDGAALPIPFSTAYQALRSLGVRAGDTLLLHGGSGAVGQAAIQFAVLWGARVLATASDRRADRVRALGAEPIAYGPGLRDRVAALAPDGVSVSLDAAGTDEALETSVAVTADLSRVATIVRGADAPRYGVRAFSAGSPTPLTAQELAWRAEALPLSVALVAAGAFSVEVDTTLALAEAVEAHRLLAAGSGGKIVLIP